MTNQPNLWDKLRTDLATDENFSDTERAALEQAYAELAERFGNALFARKHPIGRWVSDGSVISRRRFLGLAMQLQRLNDQEGIGSLCTRLVQTENAGEALDVLDWWNEFVLAGCKVNFEPKLEYKDGFADLLILSPQECYVELSKLDTGDARRNERETRTLLLELLLSWPDPVLFAGCIEYGPSSSQQQELAQELRNILCNLENEPRIIDRPGLKLGVAKLTANEALRAWAAERKLEIGQVTGLPQPAFEEWRVRRKIKVKSVQLPPGAAGILVLYSHEVYLQYALIPATFSFLENELRKYPNISALILRGIYFPQSDIPLHLTFGEHRIIAQNNGFHWECTLLLYNPMAQMPLVAVLRSQLESMLMRPRDLTVPGESK